MDKLDLNDLSKGLPGVTAPVAVSYCEAAAVCLHIQDHHPTTNLLISGNSQKTIELDWTPVTDQQLRAHNDLQDATEEGAYAISFLLALQETDFTVIERSRKGTGIDYYLGYDDNAFQHSARLEVSGIACATPQSFVSRISQKSKQAAKIDEGLPSYICIVDFGQPHSFFGKA